MVFLWAFDGLLKGMIKPPYWGLLLVTEAIGHGPPILGLVQ
jgi:hypothetical protein